MQLMTLYTKCRNAKIISGQSLFGLQTEVIVKLRYIQVSYVFPALAKNWSLKNWSHFVF